MTLYSCEVPRTIRFRDKKQNAGYQELEGSGNRELLSNDKSIQNGTTKKFWRCTMVMVAQKVNVLNALNSTPKNGLNSKFYVTYILP